MKDKIIEFYLDYANNFLSVAKIAEHYDMNNDDAATLIDMGRKFNDEKAQSKFPLMYKGFLLQDGFYTNLSTGDSINIRVTSLNIRQIIGIIEDYKH